MAYQVIKTIKGKKYLYSQSTYREAGKVKTISHYIGAVDSQTGVLTEPSDDPKHPRPHETADQIEQVLDEKHPPEPPKNKATLRNFLDEMEKERVANTDRMISQKKVPNKKAPTKTTPPKPYSQPRFKLKENCKISIPSLNNEHQQKLRILEKYGVDPAKFPPVTIKHGSKYSHYKPAFKNDLVITAPKNGFNREELRTEYRKALHQTFIETLEREAPEKLYPFKYAFDKAYRQTQDALTRYLMNTNRKNKFYKVLALKFFNVMNPVPTGNHKMLAPEKIGLVEYGKREDWKADYASLMTAIDKHGIKHLNDQAHTEIAKANAGQRKEIEKRTIFIFRKKKASDGHRHG